MARDEGAVRPGADVVLYAPLRSLALSARPRRNPARKRRGVVDPEALEIYAGRDDLLVRTALIRSDRFEKTRANLPAISSSRDVRKLCGHLAYSDQEFIVVLACNAGMQVVAIHESAKGGSATANAEMIHILKVPLLTGAAGLILVHNHPSGQTSPSKEDVAYTLRVREAGLCVGVQLFDHCIVGTGGIFSFLDAGLLR